MNRRWTGRLRVALPVLLIAAVVGAAFIYRSVGSPFDPFDNREFSATEWVAATPVERCGMARDLVRHHLSVGMTAAQVVALLGQPNFIDDGETDKAPHVGRRTYEYQLKHVADAVLGLH